ncbi:lysine-rich nucleolar protein 1 isoform X2 [Nerophis ophidion]|nr:lysine-rich nucleolar protein 1 isoform X2 [Nerophis ophidion]
MKAEDEAGENLQKNKKHKKEQTSPCKIKTDTADYKKKKKVKNEDWTLEAEECLDGVGDLQEKKKKKESVTTSWNPENCSDVLDGDNEKGNKQKIKKKETADKQMGTTPGPVKNEKTSTEKKLKNKSKHEKLLVEEEDGLAKKDKKEKNKRIQTDGSDISDDSKDIKKKEWFQQEEPKSEKKKKNKGKDRATQMKDEHVNMEEEVEKVPKKDKNKGIQTNGFEMSDEKEDIKKKEWLQQEEPKSEKKKKNKVKDRATQMKDEHVKMEEEVEKVPKKVKKDKNKGIQTNGFEISDEKEDIKKKEGLQQKEPTSEKKNKNKVKDKGTQMKHDHVKMEEEEEKVSNKEKNIVAGVIAEDQMKHRTKRKKDKAKKEIMTNEKKKLVQLAECAVASDTQEVEELKQNKKKKKKAGKIEADDADNEEPAKNKQAETTPKTNAEKGKRKYSGVSTEEEKTQSEKKKKKKQTVECEDGVYTELRKKSMKKNKKMSSGQKTKAIKEEVEDQQFQDAPQVDVVFLSARSGNADEVTINQERRQALQMEIDMASQPEPADQQTRFGQWDTAQFESSQQQQKFLRLMGGFKKPPPATTSTAKTNMALCKDTQQHLQQGLVQEFKRAHSRRMDFNSRGAGLGFSAPSNKNFHIDISARRSVQLDD